MLHVAGFLPPPYFPGQFLYLGSKGADDHNRPDSEGEAKTSKEQKPKDVEKIEPK
jgi:hypothetical protein